MFYTYILRSESTGSYYIGQTNNLTQRLLRHNTHPDRYTKGQGPWQIIHPESFATRAKAMKHERELKSYKGGNAFKKLIDSRHKNSN